MAPQICLKNNPSYSTRYGIEKAKELSARGPERVVYLSTAGAAVGVAEAQGLVSLVSFDGRQCRGEPAGLSSFAHVLIN